MGYTRSVRRIHQSWAYIELEVELLDGYRRHCSLSAILIFINVQVVVVNKSYTNLYIVALLCHFKIYSKNICHYQLMSYCWTELNGRTLNILRHVLLSRSKHRIITWTITRLQFAITTYVIFSWNSWYLPDCFVVCSHITPANLISLI